MQPLSRGLRLSLLVSTLVAAAVAPQAICIKEAKADSSEKKKVAVGAFEGAKSAAARSAFIEALKKDGGYEVTDAEDVKGSAKDKALVDSAKGLGVNVIITGKVTKLNLKLKVRDGATGKVLDEVEIKGGTLPKLKKNIEKTGASSVEGPVGQAKAEEEKKEEEKPAEEEKTEEEEDKPAEEASDSDSDSDSGSGGEGLSPLDVMVGLRPLHRTFAFHDTVADKYPGQGFYQLLRYELPLGPALFIDLNVYPGSFLGKSGPAEWIGLTGGYEKGFATKSVFLENQKDPVTMASLQQTLETDTQHFYIGARFRYPIGAHTIGASAVYGQHTFALVGDKAPLVPDVKYGYVRPMLEGNFQVGDILFGAHVGKRFVLGTGDLKRVWFPNVKTDSLEAGAHVGYRLVSMLDLIAGFDWLRYAFDFNPVPPRPAGQESYVAGGAIDEYYSGYIAFRFHMPAQGGGDGSASVSTP